MSKGDITLSVDLDTKDALHTAKDLKKEVSDALKSSSGDQSSKMTNLTSAMKKAVNEAEVLSKKLDEISKKSIPTKEYSELASEMDSLAKSYSKVSEKMASNPAGIRMSELQDKYSEAEERQRTYAKVFGEGSGPVAIAERDLGQIREEIKKLQETKDWKSFSALDAELEQIDSKMSDLNLQKEQMESSGTAFVNPQATEEYTKVATQLDSVNDKTKVAIAKQREYVESTRGMTGSSKAFINVASKGFSNVTKSIHKMSTSLNRTIKRLKRIALTVVSLAIGVRGIVGIYRKLRSMVVSGFKDIYNQDDKFKTQIDTIKQKILDIQVAFAKALMPAVQMILPYIKQLLDWILALMGGVSRFISTITGIQQYTKAIKGLGGAAKGANNQMSKLDELNVLGDSSGSGLAADDSSIPEPKGIEDWFAFTRTIVNEIQRLLEEIPWEEIQEKAVNLGKNIAAAINGIAKPEFWGKVGEAIAQSLNTAVDFLYALGEGVDWKAVGESIAAAISEFFDTFDFGQLADTIDTWVQGIWTAIKTAVTSKDEGGKSVAEKIIKGITDFVTHIDLETLEIGAAGLTILGAPAVAAVILKSILQALPAAMTTVIPELGATIAESIGLAILTALGFFLGTVGVGEAIAFDKGKFLGLTDEEWAAVNPLYKIFDVDKFNGFFEFFFDNIGLDKAILWVEDRFDEVGITFKLLGQVFLATATVVKTYIRTQLISLKADFAYVWYEIKSFVMVDIPETIQKTLNTIQTKFKDAKQKASDILGSLWEKAKSVFSVSNWLEMLSHIPTAFSIAFSTVKSTVIGVFNSIIASLENLFNNGFVGAINGLIGVANMIPDVNLSTVQGISLPRIPALAQGTVIPPSMGEFIATLGDNNTETEIVSPLSTMQEAVANVLTPYLDALISATRDVEGAINRKELTIGDRQIAESNNRGQRMIGATILR